MTSELSNKIANMGVICACCVVCIHAGQFLPSPEGSVVWWFRALFASCFARVAVPWFFVISGWLLAWHMERSGWYLFEVKKRIKSLILPMIFWCGIWVLLFECPKSNFGNAISWFGLVPWHNPAVPACWFLRALFCFVVASPILNYIVGSRTVGGMFAMILCIIAIYCKYIGFNYIERHLLGLASFSTGILIYRLKHNNIFYSRKYGSAICITLLIGVCITFWRPSYHWLYMLTIPFTIIGLWGLMPSKKWPEYITRSAFPLFLTHQMVFMFIPKSVMGFMVGDFWLYIGLCLGAILVSAAFCATFRTLCPSLANIAFGGR